MLHSTILTVGMLLYGQHVVQMDKNEAGKLGLPPADSYVVFTDKEYRPFKKKFDALQKLSEKQAELVKELKAENAALKKEIHLYKLQLQEWKQERDLLFERWDKTDMALQQERAKRWIPWAVAGAAIVAAVIASTTATVTILRDR